MVTKVAGNQGQITLKGVPITDEWQQLVTVAAKRNGQTFAEFVADVTRAAALAIVKGEAAVTAAVPIRLEDLATGLEARIADLAERQEARLDRIERASRRGQVAPVMAPTMTVLRLSSIMALVSCTTADRAFKRTAGEDRRHPSGSIKSPSESFSRFLR